MEPLRNTRCTTARNLVPDSGVSETTHPGADVARLVQAVSRMSPATDALTQSSTVSRLHAPGGMTVAPAVHTVESGARAAFERMDGAAAPQVIESTPQRIAVGVHSGGLGWVEIQTSRAAGHVTATLASGSAESHHAIATQLPAVREFLAGEHVHVDTLASGRFTASSGEREGSSGDQAGGGSERPERRPASNGIPRAGAAETDAEGLSYISVRV